MSTPEPPEGWEPTQYPPASQPPPSWDPRSQPPPGWHPGWQGPPPPRQSNDTTVVVLTALAGVSLFVALNVVVGFIAFAASFQGSSADTVPIAVAAVAAVLFAFGGGTALIMLRKPWSKGLGMGLMIGWALVTVCTVGFCTGVNPTLYSSLGAQ